MSYRVLLVDDSPIDRAVYRGMLEQKLPGVQIEDAGNVRDATRLLRDRHYDCVFLDYEMPDGTGLTVLSDVQKFNRSPVVMLTGTNEANVAVAALRSGAIDYLVKDGVEADHLVSALQEAVMHKLQLRTHEDRQRKLALLQALLLQSEELILVVDLDSHLLIEAGSVGLARLGVRRAEVIDRDVRTLAMFGKGGWTAFAAALARGPAPLAGLAGATFQARAQTLTVETTPYLVVLAPTEPA
jgi:CheY-like chemotaxis protein